MAILNFQRGGAKGFVARAMACGWALAAAFSVHGMQALAVRAQGELGEYEVKAAFLYNFTKFVEWPGDSFADAKAPIIVGIVGEDPFGASLRGIVAGQTVQGRAIVVRQERVGEDLRTCQVLFIHGSERSKVPRILASLEGSSVLTVSDMEGFAESGGVVQFVMEESRVRFVINLEAASRAGLRINSKLLALARVVHRTGR